MVRPHLRDQSNKDVAKDSIKRLSDHPNPQMYDDSSPTTMFTSDIKGQDSKHPKSATQTNEVGEWKKHYLCLLTGK